MLGTSFPAGHLPPEEEENILLGIRSALKIADITFGNLEGTLCGEAISTKCEDDTSNCYAFKMPPHYANFLADAGFDFLSLANNHSTDFGDSCLTETESLLDSLGIGWSGRPGTVSIREVNDQRVGFIAFHSGRNSNSSLQLDLAATLIESLDQDVDIIIVSLHGGGEGTEAMHLPDSAEYYLGEPRGYLKKFARRAVDAGADLVIGHGPHVPRAFELYQDRLIAYSMGNFATYGRFSLLEERKYGAILEVQLAKNGSLIVGKLHGTVQRGRGIPERDPGNHFAELVSALTLSDIADPRLIVDLDGTLIPVRP